MNRLDEVQVAALHKRIVQYAEGLAAGTVPFVDGVRALVALGREISLSSHDSDFLPLIGMSSEADHIPTAEVRRLCSESWLQQVDSEAATLEAWARKDRWLEATCARLVDRFA